MSQLLLLPKMRVQNANALSCPFTYGFPAVTAFLGFGHALQRHTQSMSHPLTVQGVGMSCHQFEMQSHQESPFRNGSLKLTANPLNEKGNRPSFVEEGRCHFSVSLLLEVSSLPSGDDEQETYFKALTQCITQRMKLAGGDILDMGKIEVVPDEAKYRHRLMPGYVLMERRELMQEAMQNGQDAIDALHDLLAVHHHCETDEQGNAHWHAARRHPGWLVPIATGYQGISELSSDARNTRDESTPHRFAESVVTLGEFAMPHRLDKPSDCLWHYAEPKDDLYLCQQSTSR